MWLYRKICSTDNTHMCLDNWESCHMWLSLELVHRCYKTPFLSLNESRKPPVTTSVNDALYLHSTERFQRFCLKLHQNLLSKENDRNLINNDLFGSFFPSITKATVMYHTITPPWVISRSWDLLQPVGKSLYPCDATEKGRKFGFRISHACFCPGP